MMRTSKFIHRRPQRFLVVLVGQPSAPLGLWLYYTRDKEGAHAYHFERRQDEDDVADLAAVFPPVLRPLQARDAHVTPLEVLHVAAAAQRRGRGGVTPTTREPPPSAEEEILLFETLFNALSQLNV